MTLREILHKLNVSNDDYKNEASVQFFPTLKTYYVNSAIEGHTVQFSNNKQASLVGLLRIQRCINENCFV